jgi:hypothetical protein
MCRFSIPFFDRSEAPIDERFADIQPTLTPQIFRQSFEDAPHDAGAHPLLKTPVAGLKRWACFRKIGPGSARA